MGVIGNVLKWLGTNVHMLGIISLLSIVSFAMTLIVERRTATIDKVLKHNELATTYNDERVAFSKSFMGHHDSIVKDNDRSVTLVDDILKTLVEFRTKYDKLLTFKVRHRIKQLEKQLMKKNHKVDFHKVSKQLTVLAGVLGKKEEKIDG